METAQQNLYTHAMTQTGLGTDHACPRKPCASEALRTVDEANKRKSAWS